MVGKNTDGKKLKLVVNFLKQVDDNLGSSEYETKYYNKKWELTKAQKTYRVILDVT
ncbi:MAG: hypothetical protein AABX08_01215 [Nanoarchaeota archaeon]